MRSPHNTMKSSPCSPQLEKAHVQQQRPNAVRKKKKKYIYIGINLCDLVSFPGYDTKSTRNKRKQKIKWTSSNFKGFMLQRVPSSKVKKQPTEWEKIFTNHISDR